MLTKQQIEAKALEEVAGGEAPLWGGGFVEGAMWAAGQAAAKIAELRAANSEQASKIVALQKERAKTEILQGAYDTAKDHTNALNAENAQLLEDKKNLNITIENAAEWSQKQADEIALLSEALQRCKAWFFQHAPTAVLPDGTGQEAHREITDVLFRAEIPANEF